MGRLNLTIFKYGRKFNIASEFILPLERRIVLPFYKEQKFFVQTVKSDSSIRSMYLRLLMTGLILITTRKL